MTPDKDKSKMGNVCKNGSQNLADQVSPVIGGFLRESVAKNTGVHLIKRELMEYAARWQRTLKNHMKLLSYVGSTLMEEATRCCCPVPQKLSPLFSHVRSTWPDTARRREPWCMILARLR
jgi:hypothetical protein